MQTANSKNIFSFHVFNFTEMIIDTFKMIFFVSNFLSLHFMISMYQLFPTNFFLRTKTTDLQEVILKERKLLDHETLLEAGISESESILVLWTLSPLNCGNLTELYAEVPWEKGETGLHMVQIPALSQIQAGVLEKCLMFFFWGGEGFSLCGIRCKMS